jgi:pteridine reductase
MHQARKAPVMSEQVILITGAARRVGAATARALHARGARIVLHYRQASADARALADSLEALRPGSVATVQGDLLDTDRCAGLVEEAVQAFGRLDGLVNNASSFHATPLGGITTQHWDDLIGTNLRAPLFLSQAAAPHLRASGGTIVNIVDIHAQQPLRDHLVYTVAKAGLAGLTRALAMELGPQVRVNGVAPGAVLWPEETGAFDARERERVVAQTLLGREGSPEDIARTVAFLVNDAPYITGQVIAVDGGRSIWL